MTNDFQTVFTGGQARRVMFRSVPDYRWSRPKKFFLLFVFLTMRICFVDILKWMHDRFVFL